MVVTFWGIFIKKILVEEIKLDPNRVTVGRSDLHVVF